MTLAKILQGAMAHGVRMAVTPAGTLRVSGEAAIVTHWVPTLRAHKRELLAVLRQAEDLREHFLERAAILEHDGGLPRETAELEAARMTAILARNKTYSWAALRLALEGYAALLEQLPERDGPVDSLPLGVAKVAVLHGQAVPQGVHRSGGTRH